MYCCIAGLIPWWAYALGVITLLILVALFYAVVQSYRQDDDDPGR